MVVLVIQYSSTWVSDPRKEALDFLRIYLSESQFFMENLGVGVGLSCS